MITIKRVIKTLILTAIALVFGTSVFAYNIVNLPETMTFDEAFGIFSAEDISRATISNYADRRYIDLNRTQINDFYQNMKDIVLYRQINPVPFRGTVLNFYTTDGKAHCYYSKSGVQVGLYGDSNYVCYVARDEDAAYMTNIDAVYRDNQDKIYAELLYRARGNDFLKLPSETWGITPVKEAAANNLLPYEFTDKYSNNITREQFCKLLANLMCVVGNYASIEDYMEDKGIIYFANYFADCQNRDNSINALHALGIVSGKSDSRFDPDGLLTREEAAAMLCRVAEKYMYIQTYGNLNFTDANSVSPWAKYYVIWANESSIMNGSESKFMPKNNYTVLEAIITVNRLYKVLVRTLY